MKKGVARRAERNDRPIFGQAVLVLVALDTLFTCANCCKDFSGIRIEEHSVFKYRLLVIAVATKYEHCGTVSESKESISSR